MNTFRTHGSVLVAATTLALALALTACDSDESATGAGEPSRSAAPAGSVVENAVDAALSPLLRGYLERLAERARDGYIIPGSQRVDTPVVNGRDVKLTIDADLQWYAQNALAKQVTAVGAESGTAVVMEVATGKVRAAASYPTFDPNDLADAKKAALEAAGVKVGKTPSETARLMREVMS